MAKKKQAKKTTKRKQKKSDKWIQEAIKNPGAFRDYCRRMGLLTKDGKVSQRCIQKGCKSKSKVIRGRACLAKTLKKLKKKRRK
jgi:hypothetical protein